MKTRTLLAALAALAIGLPADATLTTTSNSVTYVGNGSTSTFAVPFKFLAAADPIGAADQGHPPGLEVGGIVEGPGVAEGPGPSETDARGDPLLDQLPTATQRGPGVEWPGAPVHRPRRLVDGDDGDAAR